MSVPSGWDALAIVCCTIGGAAYLAAVTRLWRRAGVGRGLRVWEAGAFAAGWIALMLALFSPLAVISDILFAAHMTQHEVLMLVAAPLVVLGRPLAVLIWLGSPRGRQRWRGVQRAGLSSVWRQATRPLGVLVLHAIVLWLWHLPLLFEAALGHRGVHLLQHVSFFWTAALFWWVLVHGRYGRLGYGVGVLFVFVTAMHTSLLGALLTFSRSPWYPTHAAGAAAHGTPALEDQQLAGVLMWIPSGVLLTLIGLALFAAWLGAIERRVTRNPTPQSGRPASVDRTSASQMEAP